MMGVEKENGIANEKSGICILLYIHTQAVKILPQIKGGLTIAVFSFSNAKISLAPSLHFTSIIA